MAADMPTQLVISHGSAAGYDPAVAPSDTTTILPASKVPRHGERRGVSPGATPTSADILDAALSEDSLGLTPPRPAAARPRAASGPRSRRDLMPHRATLRSSSGARKTRAAPRPASPAVLKQLRSLQATTAPADASVEARLTALETNAAATFAYMQEAGPAIQALQAMTGSTALRVDELTEEMNRQAMDQAELHRASRREVFAMRDLLGDKMQANEVNLNAGTAAIVEAKFAQLEGFITQLQGHFVSLYERETAVEGVVAQDEATVESAFAYVDGKIN